MNGVSLLRNVDGPARLGGEALAELERGASQRRHRRGETIFVDGQIVARTNGRLVRPSPERDERKP